jgi:hypothetical protein
MVAFLIPLRQNGPIDPQMPITSMTGTTPMSFSARQQFFVGQVLPIILISVVLIVVIGIGLFSRSNYEDNLYNYAMVERSALPGNQHFLETSMVHVYFEQYQLPRAEDWHRGLSLILLTLWGRVVDPSNETLMRIPHVIWMLLWLGLAVKLLWMLDNSENDETKRSRRLWSAFLLLFAISFSPLVSVMEQGFLDDIPTTACVLCIVIWLVGWYKHNRLWTVAIAGILTGVAFLTKDFGLIWFAIVGGWLFINLLAEQPQPFFKKFALMIAVFSISYAVIITPKLLWNLSELHGLLGQPATYMNSTRYFGEGIHYLYFLYNDDTYQSRIKLLSGLHETVLSAGSGFESLSPVWLWLLFPSLGYWLKPRWSKTHQRLFIFLLLSLSAFVLFFTFGLGEASFARYWLVQFTIMIVFGINQGWVLVTNLIKSAPIRGNALLNFAVIALPLIFIYLFVWIKPINFINVLRTPAPLISKQMADTIQNHLKSGEAVMMDTQIGAYYWTLEPSSNVVGVYQKDWPFFRSTADVKHFVDAYNVRIARYSSENIINQLKELGFSEIAHDIDAVVLAR